jgi:bifunctional non-homologous end joining protein LigD
MKPMLATAADSVAGLPSDGTAWSYEVKWDGVRVLADVHDGRLRLTSRNGNDVTAAYPELADLAQAVGQQVGGAADGAVDGVAERAAERAADLLLDGEVVVLRGGVPSFEALAERMHVREPRRAQALAVKAPATFMVFDVLRQGGVDLTGRPWQERRAALEGLGRLGRAVRLSPVYDDRDVLVEATLERRLEGVVAKRRSSRYVPGGRTGDWVKLAHKHVQSCVVGGWRWETGGRDRIGALLLGVYLQPLDGDDPVDGDNRRDGDVPRRLAYSGRAGSGLTGDLEKELRRRLAPLAVEDCPFDTPVPAIDAKGATWTRPQIVVDVRYLGRGETGRLRQPVLRGLRNDLGPDDVRLEP